MKGKLPLILILIVVFVIGGGIVYIKLLSPSLDKIISSKNTTGDLEKKEASSLPTPTPKPEIKVDFELIPIIKEYFELRGEGWKGLKVQFAVRNLSTEFKVLSASLDKDKTKVADDNGNEYAVDWYDFGHQDYEKVSERCSERIGIDTAPPKATIRQYSHKRGPSWVVDHVSLCFKIPENIGHFVIHYPKKWKCEEHDCLDPEMATIDSNQNLVDVLYGLDETSYTPLNLPKTFQAEKSPEYEILGYEWFPAAEVKGLYLSDDVEAQGKVLRVNIKTKNKTGYDVKGHTFKMSVLTDDGIYMGVLDVETRSLSEEIKPIPPGGEKDYYIHFYVGNESRNPQLLISLYEKDNFPASPEHFIVNASQ